MRTHRPSFSHALNPATRSGLAYPDELFLLVEGARVSLQSVGREGPGSRLYALAEALLDSAPKKKSVKA